MTTPKGFTRLPHAVTEALQRGDITLLMFNILVLLHVWAEWRTGIVRSVSAKRIILYLANQDRPPSERTV
jgi:hypothetical protein